MWSSRRQAVSCGAKERQVQRAVLCSLRRLQRPPTPAASAHHARARARAGRRVEGRHIAHPVLPGPPPWALPRTLFCMWGETEAQMDRVTRRCQSWSARVSVGDPASLCLCHRPSGPRTHLLPALAASAKAAHFRFGSMPEASVASSRPGLPTNAVVSLPLSSKVLG